MSPRVVFDVNILVSAIIAPSGTPAAAYRQALEQDWEIVRSPHIVAKLVEVLDRPRFHGRLPARSLSAFLGGYQAFAKSFDSDPTVRGIAPDLEDDLVLGTAVAANADFLVTGDKGLLAVGEYRVVKIVTAGEFLEELAREERDTGDPTPS